MDGIILADAVTEDVDPMGQFRVQKQGWKVADYIGGSMTAAATKQMDVRVVDSLQRMGYNIRGVLANDPAAVGMFGCCAGVTCSEAMLRGDRPMDPSKDLLVMFWGMNEIMPSLVGSEMCIRDRLHCTSHLRSSQTC